MPKKQPALKSFLRARNNSESKLDLTLAQGIAKGEKMDFLIQKAVELGVKRIIPMKLERCVVRLRDEKVQKKIDHWQKIANHACEQSGRSVIVTVSDPVSLEGLLEERATMALFCTTEHKSALVKCRKLQMQLY